MSKKDLKKKKLIEKKLISRSNIWRIWNVKRKIMKILENRVRQWVERIIKLILLIIMGSVISGRSQVSFEYEDCLEHEGCICIEKYTGNKKTFDLPETIEGK